MKIKFVLFVLLIFSLASCKDKNEESTDEGCKHEYRQTIVEPGCLEKGYTINHCDICGNEYVDSYVDALGHQYFRTFKQKEDGTIYFELTCAKCQHTDEEVLKTQPKDLYGYNDLKRFQNSDRLEDFYVSLIMTCDMFDNSNVDLEKETIVVGNNRVDYYVIDKLEYASYNLNLNEALAVLNILNMENPKYYFLSNEVVYDDNFIYLVTSEECSKSENRIALKSSIDSLIKKCEEVVKNISIDNKREIIRAIHDFLITEMEYAYVSGTTKPETSLWAHSIIGASKYKKGVCEAYSKAFKCLCDYFNINCLVVEGQVNGAGHSWNIVKIDDSWYGIDLTFDDLGSGIGYECFLIGYTKMNEKYAQYSSLTLNINYVYLTPSLSLNDYEI